MARMRTGTGSRPDSQARGLRLLTPATLAISSVVYPRASRRALSSAGVMRRASLPPIRMTMSSGAIAPLSDHARYSRRSAASMCGGVLPLPPTTPSKRSHWSGSQSHSSPASPPSTHSQRGYEPKSWRFMIWRSASAALVAVIWPVGQVISIVIVASSCLCYVVGCCGYAC